MHNKKTMYVESSNKYGKIDLARLEAFEDIVGAKLSNDYREFLIKHNGGKPTPSDFNISKKQGDDSIHHFYGLHDGPSYSKLDDTYETYFGRIPDSMIPIADDPAGNAICIGIKQKYKGQVLFWDHELEGDLLSRILGNNITVLSTTFNEFLDSLFEWVDPNETEIEKIIRTDDTEQLKNLISSGYNIESLDINGRSAIEKASIAAKNNIIKILLESGASLRTSIDLAEQNAEHFEEHKSTVKLLDTFKNNA